MEINKKFKQMYDKEVKPRIKIRDKLYSERDKLDSKRDKFDSKRTKLYFKINKLDSERKKLNSERSKFYSEMNKLDSERDKLDSEREKIYSKGDKLCSEILMSFYKFGKENNCEVVWISYDFELKNIKIKQYNSDKTGFIVTDMKGKETEELFEEEVEKIIKHNGHKYRLVKE